MAKLHKRVLIAPLDWGLGHATRCIPIIKELLHLGVEVVVGATGKQAVLLQEEFPEVTLLNLPGYNIQYTADARHFGWAMVRQLPQIRQAIHNENNWLRRVVAQYDIDAVISDNRFGLHHPRISSVIMTHQLLVKSPFGKTTEYWLRKVNYHYIQKFNACWVVDFEGKESLAGALSHPGKKPKIPLAYLGALSRFSYSAGKAVRYDVLVVISGPEPQRSIFEKIILAQISASSLSALMVTGKPGETIDTMVSPKVRQVNHLDSHELNEALLQSKIVICRSGYTSVMDLVKLRKKAILVPTPGQTEQEYLADYLMKKGYFYTVEQEAFNLENAMAEAADFPFYLPEVDMEKYRDVIRDFALASLH